ncbi:MAG: CBS domain-containing protein [Sphingobacteriaceae bacterium]|nr:CBS domain-containing protein [Sphingobacteriaceae bacterium]
MIVSEIQLSLVPVLKPSDAVSFAMDRMLESRLFDLPVVDEDQRLLGMLRYETLEEQDEDSSLESFKAEWKDFSVRSSDPFVRLLHLFEQDQTTAVPVVDEDDFHVGTVQVHDLAAWLATQSVVAQPGGLLTLKVAQNNYSLSEIARIAESNNGTIINLRLSPADEPEFMLIHLKLNLMDLTYVMATFERFGYRIQSFNHQSHLSDFYTERYDALMRYLDI